MLARSYGLPSWPRLVLACRMTDAIWRDDVDAVRELVVKHPQLLHENARGVKGNWGPPMSYAANLGRDRIIAMLRELGAEDLQHAFDRACLQGRIDTARQLHAMGARPEPGCRDGAVRDAERRGSRASCSSSARRSATSTATGSRRWRWCSRRTAGTRRASTAASRSSPSTASTCRTRRRWRCIAAGSICSRSTCAATPACSSRTFAHEEIYPPELGCHADHSLALHGTPLAGATLLHLCVDYDEIEIARWLIERGADVNARAAVDAEGFGGHTALFGCVVSQPLRVGLRQDDVFARSCSTTAPTRTPAPRCGSGCGSWTDETMHEYRDVTPLAWGERFHDQGW